MCSHFGEMFCQCSECQFDKAAKDAGLVSHLGLVFATHEGQRLASYQLVKDGVAVASIDSMDDSITEFAYVPQYHDIAAMWKKALESDVHWIVHGTIKPKN